MTHPILRCRKSLHFAGLALDQVLDDAYAGLTASGRNWLRQAIEAVAELRAHFDDEWDSIFRSLTEEEVTVDG